MFSCFAAPELPPGESQPLQKPKNGALDSSTPPDLYTTRTFGYLLQYFAVGLVYGGLPATNYGLFICYLNVPAYVSSAATTLATFPWSVKILFAFATDGFPIGGYRRRPWMMIGWSICSIFLIALALTPLPPPYYCIEEGRLNLHKVCNPAAASSGFPFAVLLCLAACGYVAADVAADGLTVSYARREGLSTRGTTQTTAYLVRTFGQIGAQLLVGFGMNGPEYEGTFGAGLSFNAVCAILAVPSAAMIVISWVAIEEDRVGEDERRTVDGSGEKGKAVEEDVVHSPTSFVRTCWSLFESAAMLEVVLFQFLTGAIGGISTTAGPEIQRVWAGVQNLQNQLFSVGGNLLFILGLWLVRQRFLHVSWRLMLAVTSVLVTAIDIPFTFLTVFDVVRNQYFYLDDTLITAIPAAASFIVATFVIVEVAQPGSEAITYGVLTTAGNLGGPVSSGLSNWLFSFWQPSLSDSANYVDDSTSFRTKVAVSCALGYCFTLISLLFLPLLPDQKADTHARLASRPRHSKFALITVVLLLLALVYSLVVDFLSVIPSTSCLQIAGGSGCDSKSSRV